MGCHSLRSHQKPLRYPATGETSPYLLSPPMPLRCDQVKNGLSSICSLKSGTLKSAQPTSSFQPSPDLLATPWPHTAAPLAHIKDLPSPSLGRTYACIWHGTRNETKRRKDTAVKVMWSCSIV